MPGTSTRWRTTAARWPTPRRWTRSYGASRSCAISVTPFRTWGQNVDYLAHWLSARNAWFGTNVSHLGNFDATNRPFTYDGFDYGLVYDYDYYLQMNPDVAAAFHGDPELTLRHFVEHGMAEGRVSSRMFDLATYKANNPDVVAAFGNRAAEYYRHYCNYGFKEARVAV